MSASYLLSLNTGLLYNLNTLISFRILMIISFLILNRKNLMSGKCSSIGYEICIRIGISALNIATSGDKLSVFIAVD